MEKQQSAPPALAGVSLYPIPNLSPEGWMDELFRHVGAVRKVADAVLGDEEAAEDVVQETMIRAHRSRERYDGRASISTWLCTIATNIARDELRRQKRQRAYEADVRPTLVAAVLDLSAVDPDVDTGALLAKLRSAMEELPARWRSVLVLHYYEGLPYEEVGLRLKVHPGRVRGIAMSARRFLREYLTRERLKNGQSIATGAESSPEGVGEQ